MHRNWIAVAVLAFAGAGQALAQEDDDKQDGAFIGVGIGDFSSSSAWSMRTPVRSRSSNHRIASRAFCRICPRRS